MQIRQTQFRKEQRMQLISNANIMIHLYTSLCDDVNDNIERILDKTMTCQF